MKDLFEFYGEYYDLLYEDKDTLRESTYVDFLLKENVKTLAEILEDNAYLTGHLGKWHLGDDTVKQRGGDEWVSVEEHITSSYYDGELPYSDLHNWLISKGHTPTAIGPTGKKIFDDAARSFLPEDSQMASFLAEKAEDFIDRNKDAPYLLYVSTFAPHSPYGGPLDGMYDTDLLPTGPTFLKKPENVADIDIARAEYHSSFLGGADHKSDEYMYNYLACR